MITELTAAKTPSLLFLDCETCDFNGGILSLALNKVEAFFKISSTNELEFKASGQQKRFKNPWPISSEAFAIHGISEKDVAEQPLYVVDDFYAMARSLHSAEEDLLDGVVLVGHNILGFDLRVLGISAPFRCIDTLVLARKLCAANILKHNNELLKLGNKLDSLVSLYCSQEAAHLKEFHDASQDNYKTFVFLRFLLQEVLQLATLDNLVTLCLSQPPAGVSKASFKNIQSMLLNQMQGI